ncbi:MAG: hypothetical protein RL112_2487 [Planctomycetota bacterium]|jgi:DUF971 family protein
MSHAPQPVAAPKSILRSDPTRVAITWQDGSTSEWTAATLRRACPCARCVHEITGERLLDPLSVPDDLTQSDLALVGHYAVSMVFSDGHHTGIYTWGYLRGLV